MFVSCQYKQEPTQTKENQVVNTIMTRRSIRKYQPQAVARDTMDPILQCGINAPNGQNKQSWEVRVVDSPVLLDAMRDAMVQGHPDMPTDMVRGSSAEPPRWSSSPVTPATTSAPTTAAFWPRTWCSPPGLWASAPSVLAAPCASSPTMTYAAP